MKVGANGAGRVGTVHVENLHRHPDVFGIIVTEAKPTQTGHVAAHCGGKTTVGAEACGKLTREGRTVTLEEVA